jgi:hypothetical protein
MVLQRVYQLSSELQKTKHGLKVLQKLQKTYSSVMSSFQNIIGVQPVANGFNYNNATATAGLFSPNRIQSASNNHSHSAGGYNNNNRARKFAQYTPAGATY